MSKASTKSLINSINASLAVLTKLKSEEDKRNVQLGARGPSKGAAAPGGGTGYSGGRGESAISSAKAKAVAKRHSEDDAKVQSAFVGLRNALAALLASERDYEDAFDEGKKLVAKDSWEAMFAYLSLYLRNESLSDVVARSGVYSAILQFLSQASQHPLSCLKVFSRPVTLDSDDDVQSLLNGMKAQSDLFKSISRQKSDDCEVEVLDSASAPPKAQSAKPVGGAEYEATAAISDLLFSTYKAAKDGVRQAKKRGAEGGAPPAATAAAAASSSSSAGPLTAAAPRSLLVVGAPRY